MFIYNDLRFCRLVERHLQTLSVTPEKRNLYKPLMEFARQYRDRFLDGFLTGHNPYTFSDIFVMRQLKPRAFNLQLALEIIGKEYKQAYDNLMPGHELPIDIQHDIEEEITTTLSQPNPLFYAFKKSVLRHLRAEGLISAEQASDVTSALSLVQRIEVSAQDIPYLLGFGLAWESAGVIGQRLLAECCARHFDPSLRILSEFNGHLFSAKHFLAISALAETPLMSESHVRELLYAADPLKAVFLILDPSQTFELDQLARATNAQLTQMHELSGVNLLLHAYQRMDEEIEETIHEEVLTPKGSVKKTL